MDFASKWKEYIDATERALKYYLSSDTINPTIREAMCYSVFAGGKRLRPVLSLATCDMICGDYSKCLPLAAGIEMIHTYSLIHDDLPAMDNDDMRRGKPTNHKVYGEAIALLAGDGLLNLAFESMLCGVSEARDIKAYIQAMKIIAAKAGTSGMIAGQVADLTYEHNALAGESELNYVHSHKTGAMIVAAVLSGAHCGGGDSQAVDMLFTYGTHLGLAFQITDDILDVTGTSALMGKTLGKDERDEKLTFVKIYGLEKAKDMAKLHTEKAVDSLRKWGDRGWFLSVLANDMCNRQN